MKEIPNLRNDKQNEFYLFHKRSLDRNGITQNDFTIKTAFYSNLSSIPGKNIQLFDGEIRKNKDIYIELFDKIKDDNENVIDYSPYDDNRPLFIYKANPHYKSEYPIKYGGEPGKEYETYLVNLSELKVLWKDKVITFAEYEKIKNDAIPPAKEQNRVNDYFPDFEEEFSSKAEIVELSQKETDAPLSEITIRDLAAIMLMKPVSNRSWLNDLIKQTKSEL